MHLFIRCLLWILMAALPLQGSAALFAACKSSVPAPAHPCHPAGLDAMGSAMHAAHDSAMEYAGRAAHADGEAVAGGADRADRAEGAGGAAPPDHGKAPVKPHGKCSSCASCCTAATAPPLDALASAPFPRPGRALPPPIPRIGSTIPDPLDRPPRAA